MLRALLLGLLVGLPAAAAEPASRPAQKAPTESPTAAPTPIEDVKRVLESPDGPQPKPEKLKELDEHPNVARPHVEEDLRVLGSQLQLYSEEADRIRVATALTGLGIGAVLLPSGLVLLSRSDGLARSVVIGMIVGGALNLASVPLVFIPTPMDEIYADFMARPVKSESQATIKDIEHKWQEAAESSRRRRKIVGTTLLIVGSASLITGLTLLLAPEGVLGMSRQAQYTVGGVTMGMGIPMTTVSVRLLLQWSLEESSWHAYRTMKEASRGARARPSAPTFGVVPLPDGAVAFGAFDF